MNIFSFAKKPITIFLIGVFLLSPRGVVNAGLPVFDASVFGQTMGTYISASKAFALDIAKQAYELKGDMLDGLAYAAAQNALNQITENTVKWIQGGFHGKPSFAVDAEQALLAGADAVAGGLALEIKSLAMCDFSFRFKDDLRLTTITFPKKRYTWEQSTRCPLPALTQSGLYKDFMNGGFVAFGAALSDRGNPYGTQIITANELQDRIKKEKDVSKEKLAWSKGFISFVDTRPGKCKYPADIQRNWDGLSDENKKFYQRYYCPVTTPGSIVGDQLGRTLGMDMERIGFSDNMNKIIGAFIEAFTQETIRKVF